MAYDEKVSHPGEFIRQRILPKGMTVTEAAERIRVSRPALSNLLNGKVALSPEMAIRLEKAFGADREHLLAMQAEFEKPALGEKEKSIAVKSFVPQFLTITSIQIEAWAERGLPTRSLLPAFVRKLVFSTSDKITSANFPAYTRAETHGWDGTVDSDVATPWIPEGVSGWEMGCSEEPRAKAEDDYKARTRAIPAAERRRMTFVFVTPRNWSGKAAWVNEKSKLREWKDIRAYDSGDLEQWLGESLPAQIWLAANIGHENTNVRTLDHCWNQWAEVAEPELSKELFKSAVSRVSSKFYEWLAATPMAPFVVAADSIDEGLAFLACLLESAPADGGQYYERAIVMDTVESFRRSISASLRIIPIIADDAVEKASGGVFRRHHTILVRTKNIIREDNADVTLDILDNEEFERGLKAMGVDRNRIDQLARESGQSLTILRRRLASKLPAIQTPPWAFDRQLAKRLVPIWFVGVWNCESKADCEILRYVTDASSYDDIEKLVAELLDIEQPPIWAIGSFRSVISKIDVLYAIHRLVTPTDLDKFFDVAEIVLDEHDPSLDLPEEKQWLAGLYGKSRDHSSALREGIAETLVLLAIHGNNLFSSRINENIEARVSQFVRRLLSSFDTNVWMSQKGDLPRYAEAAPNAFLEIIEQDLNSSAPSIFALLKPADSSLFGGCPRSGLLWALEGLAWKPDYLLRVSRILARLAEQKIEDNWANKPENTLGSIYRAWMPQTSANVSVRIECLQAIAKEFPAIGWHLCIEQFDPRSSVGTYNYRPRWRTDHIGFGEVTNHGALEFRQQAVAIALNWPKHNADTFINLLERLGGLTLSEQEDLFLKIRAWCATDIGDDEKARLLEGLRKNGPSSPRIEDDPVPPLIAEIYLQLSISDVVVKHQWLFANEWLDFAHGDLDKKKLDHQARSKDVDAKRQSALKEIWSTLGYQGLLRICDQGNASIAVGRLMAKIVTNLAEAHELLTTLAKEIGIPGLKVNLCISGYLSTLDEGDRAKILEGVVKKGNEQLDEWTIVVRILQWAPFNSSTWSFVDDIPEAMRTLYWKTVVARWDRQSEEEFKLLTDQLLAVGRPRAAVEVVHLDWDQVDSERIVAILTALASSIEASTLPRPVADYEITPAFETLDRRKDIAAKRLAQLEFMYLPLLDHAEFGLPNLERQICESPELFAQLVALVYTRKDGEADPAELLVLKDKDAKRMAEQSYRLLKKLRRIPGSSESGSIELAELKKWIVAVREQCAHYGRADVGDLSLGEFLAHSPLGSDGYWPCEPVREVVEIIKSQNMARGISIGLFNAAGATWRGSGGDQERALAEKHRHSSKGLAMTHPFVSQIMESLATDYDRQAEWHDKDAKIRHRLRD